MEDIEIREKIVERLKKDFRKANLMQGKLNQVNDDITTFEELYKNNDVLRTYIELLEKRKMYEERMNEAKKYLYDDMLEADKDELNGTNIDAKLKRPYIVTEIKTQEFLEDNKEGSRLYKKYVEQKERKGNITIKVVDKKKSK